MTSKQFKTNSTPSAASRAPGTAGKMLGITQKCGATLGTLILVLAPTLGTFSCSTQQATADREWATEVDQSGTGRTPAASADSPEKTYANLAKQMKQALARIGAEQTSGAPIPSIDLLWKAADAFSKNKPHEARLLFAQFLIDNQADPSVATALSGGSDIPAWFQEKMDEFNVQYNSKPLVQMANNLLTQSHQEVVAIYNQLNPNNRGANNRGDNGHTGGVMAKLWYNVSKKFGGREAQFQTAMDSLSGTILQLTDKVNSEGGRTALNLSRNYQVFALELEMAEEALKGGLATFPDHVQVLSMMADYFSHTGTFGSRKVLQQYPDQATLLDSIMAKRATLGEKELGENYQRADVAYISEVGQAAVTAVMVVDTFGLGSLAAAGDFKIVSQIAGTAFGASMAYQAIDESNQLGFKSTDVMTDINWGVNLVFVAGMGAHLIPLNSIKAAWATTPRGVQMMKNLTTGFKTGEFLFMASQGIMAGWQMAHAKDQLDVVHALESLGFAAMGGKGLLDSIKYAKQNSAAVADTAKEFAADTSHETVDADTTATADTAVESPAVAKRTAQQLAIEAEKIINSSKTADGEKSHGQIIARLVRNFQEYVSLPADQRTTAQSLQYARAFETEANAVKDQRANLQTIASDTTGKEARAIRGKITRRDANLDQITEAELSLAQVKAHEASYLAAIQSKGIQGSMDKITGLLKEAVRFEASGKVREQVVSTRRTPETKLAALKLQEKAYNQAAYLYGQADAELANLLAIVQKEGKQNTQYYASLESMAKTWADAKASSIAKRDELSQQVAALDPSGSKTVAQAGTAKPGAVAGDTAGTPEQIKVGEGFMKKAESHLSLANRSKLDGMADTEIKALETVLAQKFEEAKALGIDEEVFQKKVDTAFDNCMGKAQASNEDSTKDMFKAVATRKPASSGLESSYANLEQALSEMH